MKNMVTLKTAGSKLFSSPVLAEKSLGAVGLEKKEKGNGGMKWWEATVLFQMKCPKEEHRW